MANATLKSKRILIFDLLRGLAIIQILLYHIFLFYTDKSILSRATGIKENFLRFKNPLGYILASGYQGVHLFLIISGFLLTLSMAKKNYSLLQFYKKRLKRILIPYYPVWLISIILLLSAKLLPYNANPPVNLTKELLIKTLLFPLYFDFQSNFLSQINRAWWFLPLILELYIIFPFLITIKKKLSAITFLIITSLVTVHYRLLAVYFLKGSPIGVIAPTSGGSAPFIFFPARLFEFCLGISLASMYLKNKNLFKGLSSWFYFFLGIVFQLLGTIFTFYKPFWVVSDILISIGILLISIKLVYIIKNLSKAIAQFLIFLGNLSYPLYLIHYLLLLVFLAPLLSLNQGKIIYLSLLPLYFLILILLSKLVAWIDGKIR
jgi:peptidoglycan/LPS O-acetylase OafA/YrhL